jgi:hypothetical protein
MVFCPTVSQLGVKGRYLGREEEQGTSKAQILSTETNVVEQQDWGRLDSE